MLRYFRLQKHRESLILGMMFSPKYVTFGDIAGTLSGNALPHHDVLIRTLQNALLISTFHGETNISTAFLKSGCSVCLELYQKGILQEINYWFPKSTVS